MNFNNISINKDRVAVELPNNTTAQFVVWDLQEQQHADLEQQITTAFAICSTLDDVVNHLNINGYDASLEDIYES